MKKKSKVLGIDYGSKRSGISITNDNKTLALALTCIDTNYLIDYIDNIIKKENIDTIVLGYPITLNNKNQKITNKVLNFKNYIKEKYKNIIVELIDERYSTKLAKYYFYKIKFNKDSIKTQLNIMSSILILQSYLNKIKK